MAEVAVRRRWLVGFAVLLGILVGHTAPPASGLDAASHAYDVVPVARVDTHGINAIVPSSFLLSGSREQSVSSAAPVRGSSTTPPAARNATEAASAGPRVGSGASLDNLSPGEITRIQNAANKIDQPINVVGSRASGTAGPYSDWDYVVPGANSSTVGKIKNSLPEGPRGIGDPRNIDIFRGQVNEGLPFITFTPTPR